MKMLLTLFLFTLFFSPVVRADDKDDAAKKQAQQQEQSLRSQEIAKVILLRIYPNSVDWNVGEFNQVRDAIAKMIFTYVLDRQIDPLFAFIIDTIHEQSNPPSLPSFRLGAENVSFYWGTRSLGPHPDMRSEFWQMSSDPARNKKIAEDSWVAHYATTAFIRYYLPKLELKMSHLDNSPTGFGTLERKTAVKAAALILPYLRHTDERNDFLLKLLNAARQLDEFIDVAAIYLFEVHQQNVQAVTDQRETSEQARDKVLELFISHRSFAAKAKSEFFKTAFGRDKDRPEFDFFKRQKLGLNPLTWLHQMCLKQSPRWTKILSTQEQLRLLPIIIEEYPEVPLVQMLNKAREDNFRLSTWESKLNHLTEHVDYLGYNFVMQDLESRIETFPERRVDLINAANNYPVVLREKVLELANKYSNGQRFKRFLKEICAPLFQKAKKII